MASIPTSHARRQRRESPTVGIRTCAFASAAANRRKFRARYANMESHLSDLPTIVHEALRTRFAPPLHDRAGERADLEYVPWACLLHPRISRPPRFGSFTIFPSAWASFALECFDDTRAMCASAQNCSSGKLRGVAVLSIENPSYMPAWYQSLYSRAEMAPVTLNVSRLATLPGGAAFQIPYPTSSHWDGFRLPDAPPLSARKVMAALVANVRENGTMPQAETIGRSPLRTLLHAECHAAPAGDCVSRGAQRGSSGIWQTNNETDATYRRAVFCLQPWGDSATRKGFWDALLAGCINAVFGEAGWNETDAWYGDHREYTVRVPLRAMQPGGIGALAFLKNVGAGRVRQLHANVQAVRARTHYAIHGGVPGGDGDGVDVLVEQLKSHFARRRAAGDLPRSYHGNDACRNIIHHICQQATCRPRRAVSRTPEEVGTPRRTPAVAAPVGELTQ